MEKNRGNFCLAVSIDIKCCQIIDFNSEKWSDIIKDLRFWEIPWYLLNIFSSYFSKRSGSIESQCLRGEKIEIGITGEVPQGSVMSSLLWNITYNSVWNENLPEGCALLGFADDTSVIVAAKTIADLKQRVNRPLEQITGKISDLGLQIVAEKTDAVLFISRYKYNIPYVIVCSTPITPTDHMTYLGIVIDKSCLFKAHIKEVTQKVARIGASLARLMPNVGDPREARR